MDSVSEVSGDWAGMFMILKQGLGGILIVPFCKRNLEGQAF